MPGPAIYASSLPSVTYPSSSLFTYLFSQNHGPEKPVFIDGLTGEVVTRGALRSTALHLAAGARAKLGIKRGETALVFSPNTITFPIILLALIAAGAPATLSNASYTPSELAHQYTDARARVLFVHPALLPIARKMFQHIGVKEDEVRKRLVVLDLDKKTVEGFTALGSLLNDGELAKEESFDGRHSDETAVMCYSSGTTGLPKGVETTHKNLVAQLAQLSSLGSWDQNDVFIAVLPFFHIYGLVVLLLNPLFMGSSVVVFPQFTPDSFFGSIARYRVTQGIVVPPILLALVHHPAAKSNDLTSLKVIISGAAPLSIELTKAVQDALKDRGVNAVLTQGFGMTETSPVCLFCTVDRAPVKPASVGTLLPNLYARLVKSDDDEIIDAGPGESGELWIKGPTVMKGYVRKPQATAATITPDGWLKSGDVAIRDEEGFFWIVDRKKELIKYKGFQVSPAELEDLLLGHPDIVDAAVIGVNDPVQSTELPRAYVVRSPKAAPIDPAAFESDVKKFIASRVAKHKQLRGGVAILDAIPKSASGKILRRELRVQAEKELKAKAKL